MINIMSAFGYYLESKLNMSRIWGKTITDSNDAIANYSEVTFDVLSVFQSATDNDRHQLKRCLSRIFTVGVATFIRYCARNYRVTSDHRHRLS